MPKFFDEIVNRRNFSTENVDVMRDAYLSAAQILGLADSSSEERQALVEIIQQLAMLEPFRKSEHMASLAVEWYRSRR
jgi:hypothetical protein